MGPVKGAAPLERGLIQIRLAVAALALCAALPEFAWAGDEQIALAAGGPATGAAALGATMPWWFWPLLLFVVCFFLGIVAVLGGVGGGVLFVPIVSGFFPFHLDFVRGAGLMVALAAALAASPRLLKSGMASLRLAMPLALIGSASSIVGALVGLALPANLVQFALGLTLLAIVALMWRSKKSDFPHVEATDPWAAALRMSGAYFDAGADRVVEWRTHRTKAGLVMFVGIGMMAGMFGLGAGWANVPVLNLLMGAPLKVSVATSMFVLSIVDSSAAWVYLNQGAVLAIITVPSIIGMMVGSTIGVRLLTVAKASLLRKVVIGLLLVAGGRAMLKAFGI